MRGNLTVRTKGRGPDGPDYCTQVRRVHECSPDRTEVHEVQVNEQIRHVAG